jgi:hypothetical protein
VFRPINITSTDCVSDVFAGQLRNSLKFLERCISVKVGGKQAMKVCGQQAFQHGNTGWFTKRVPVQEQPPSLCTHNPFLPCAHTTLSFPVHTQPCPSLCTHNPVLPCAHSQGQEMCRVRGGPWLSCPVGPSDRITTSGVPCQVPFVNKGLVSVAGGG